jgi:hypothetical protein
MYARHRKRRNYIPKLNVGDQIITSHEDKAAAVFDFYSNLIGSDLERRRTIDLTAIDIPGYDLSALDAPFTYEEVWNTIKPCSAAGIKSPKGSYPGRDWVNPSHATEPLWGTNPLVPLIPVFKPCVRFG